MIISINTLLINLALALVLPAVTAFTTHQKAPSWLKTSTLTVLSVVGGVLTQILVQGNSFHWKPAVLSVGSLLIASISAHFGILKPSLITGADGIIARAFPGGIGKIFTQILNTGEANAAAAGAKPVTAQELKNIFSDVVNDIFRTRVPVQVGGVSGSSDSSNANVTVSVTTPTVVSTPTPVEVVEPDPVVDVPAPAQTDLAPSVTDEPTPTTDTAPASNVAPTTGS